MKRHRLLTAMVASTALVVLLGVVACDSDEETPPPANATLDSGLDGDASSTPVQDSSVSDQDVKADAPDELVDASAVPVTCGAPPCAVEIVAGATSVCVRLSDGTVECWGFNTSGELGRGAPDAGAPLPTNAKAARVVGLTNVTQLTGAPSAPADAYCARRADGSVWCWGSNTLGVLGRVPRNRDAGLQTASSPTAAPVFGVAGASGVFLGRSVGCVTFDANATTPNIIQCWGTNEAAQIPSARLGAVVGLPARIDLPSPARDLAVTDRGTVALLANGTVLSWGLRGEPSGPDTGVLGREVSIESAPPAAVDVDVVSRAAGSTGRVCVNANGRIHCWGVGATSGSDSVYPTYVGIGSALGFAQSLAVGPQSVCATASTGTATCWGNNAKGQLGVGNTDLQPLPVSVRGLAGRPVRLATMNAATCALLATGTVQCWGDNTEGQLGLGSADALGHLEPKIVELAP